MLYVLLVLVPLLFVVGCGSNAKPQFAKGVFVDSPVEGLRYVSGTISGKTTSGGLFSYQVGSSIKFYVGDLLIGEALPTAMISPIDLVPGATDAHHPKVVKIVKFLLTVNSSNDVERSMLIDLDKHSALVGVNKDLRDDTTDLQALRTTLQTALKTTFAFCNSTTARLHLKSSLAASKKTDEIPLFTFAFTSGSALKKATYQYYSPSNAKFNPLAGATAFTNMSSSTTNTRAITRIHTEIAAQRPQLLVEGGDLVAGFGTSIDPSVNAAALQSQYGYVRGMMSSLFEASLLNPQGIYVLPLAGERELSDKIATGSTITKGTYSYTSKGLAVSSQANEQLWSNNMQDIILDNMRFGTLLTPKGLALVNFDSTNYPQIASEANIFTSQQFLSYSFEIGSSHFVIINTDPANPNDPVNSTVYSAPTNWLKQDLTTARSRLAIKHIFIFGHRPAWSYNFADTKSAGAKLLDALDGKDAVTTQARAAAFWNLVEQYQATYFSGHMGVFNASQGSPPITDTASFKTSLFTSPDGSITIPNSAASTVFLRYTGVVGNNYPNLVTGKAWQIICGTAGSTFAAIHPASGATACTSTVANCSTNPDNFMYAWVLAKVYSASTGFPNGRVHMTAYGFDDSFGKTRVIQSWDLDGAF